MSELPDWAKAIPGFDPTGDWLPIVCCGSHAQPHPVELIGVYFPDADSGEWRWEGSPVYDENGNHIGYAMKRDVMVNVRWFREANGERVETWVEEDGTKTERRLPSDVPDGEVRTGMTSEGRGTAFIGCPNPVCQVNPRVTVERFEEWLQMGRAEGRRFLNTPYLCA